MAVLSRSSLRGSVRRNPDDHLAHGRQGAPIKRQRTLHDLWPVNRRRSSPDCLDATTPTDADPIEARHNLPPVKPTRPRPATRRTRRRSASSVDSAASGDQLIAAATPRVNGNGVTNLRRLSDRDTPAGTHSATAFLRGEPESPDPLDTISPAVTMNTVKARPGAHTQSVNSETRLPKSPAATRTTRRGDHDTKPNETDGTQSTAKSDPKDVTSLSLSDVLPANATRSQQQQQCKHEGGNMEQDPSVSTGNERRSLRSADTGSRCKSELAQYFHNYEQIISLDDPKPGESGPLYLSRET